MKNKIVALLLVGIILLVGCGLSNNKSANGNEATSSENGVTSKDDESVTISFYARQDDADFLQPAIDEFIEKTGINVEMKSYPPSEYYDKLLLLLNAQEDLDVMLVGHSERIMQFVEAGVLEPLDEYIEKDGLDLSVYGEGHTKYKFDGHYYSLPYRRVVWLLYTNDKLLNEAGVTIPENMTWEQYAEIAKELTKGEGADKVFGGQWINWGNKIQLVQNGSTIFDDDLSGLRDELEWKNQVMNIDNSFMDYGEMLEGGSDYTSWFVNGKTATMIMGEWVSTNINSMVKEKGIDLSYSMHPMPIGGNTEPYSTAGNYSDVAINANSKNKKEAFEFVKFLSGKECGIKVAESNRIPGYLSDEAREAFLSSEGSVDTADVVFNLKINEFVPGIEGGSQISTIIDEEFELFLTGGQDIDTTMENIYNRRAKLLEKINN